MNYSKESTTYHYIRIFERLFKIIKWYIFHTKHKIIIYVLFKMNEDDLGQIFVHLQ